MKKEDANWYNVIVGLLCFGAFIVLFVRLGAGFQQTQTILTLPLLVITGVMALFATLAIVAVTFSVAGLSDPTQALGLPEGSVRAAIALALIVIFAITAIFFYNSTATRDDPYTALPSDDFAKQVFAVVGTLMTSVVSFYFASRATTTPVQAATKPELISVTPSAVTQTGASQVVSLTIQGTGLQLAKTVKFQMDGGTVLATDVTSNEQSIKCQLTVDPSLSLGKYDVIVTTSDGATAVLSAAFEIAGQPK